MANIYLIKRDGKIIGVHQGNESLGALPWFSQNVFAYSMDHATKYDGYSVEMVDDIDCHDVAPILEAIAERKGIRVSVEFVPFSKSRNAKPDPKISEMSLNWKVTIDGAGAKIETDYMRGVAHAPSYKAGARATLDYHAALTSEIETGRIAPKGNMPIGRKPINPPAIGDILHCLVRDSEDVMNSAGFEDWAEECGYDIDSRAAEKIYRQCLDIALKMKRIFGHAMGELETVSRFN